MRRKLLTPLLLEQRPPSAGRVEIRDSLSPLILRITAAGRRSFVVRVRIKGRKQPIRLSYHEPAHTSVLENARAWAVESVGKCRRGIDPRQERAAAARTEAAKVEMLARGTFKAVAETFLEKHASKNRTGDETARLFKFYLLPRFGHVPMGGVKRRAVAELLDEIEARQFRTTEGKLHGGPVIADRVLACIRKFFNWHAARDDEFVSPIVKGMARTKPKDRARDRVLSDAEIRAFWAATGDDKLTQCDPRRANDTWAALVRTLLLTAQRREEVAQMKRTEVDANGVWTIPAERYKTGKPNAVPMSVAVLAIIQAQPQVDDSELVFTTTGKTPFSGFTKAKRRLDAAMLANLRESAGERASKITLPAWRLHDLRRTAKTLMVRAGVRPDISERVLGHVIGGVEGVYDRHAYLDEKRLALEALAGLLERITSPASVVNFPRAACG